MQIEVTDDLKEMLEAALNCMMVVADAQINDEAAEALEIIADAIAEEFGIEKINTEVLEGTDENGNDVTVIRDVKPKPKFRIIDGSKPDGETEF
jgi:hypothetical protein